MVCTEYICGHGGIYNEAMPHQSTARLYGDTAAIPFRQLSGPLTTLPRMSNGYNGDGREATIPRAVDKGEAASVQTAPCSLA